MCNERRCEFVSECWDVNWNNVLVSRSQSNSLDKETHMYAKENIKQMAWHMGHRQREREYKREALQISPLCCIYVCVMLLPLCSELVVVVFGESSRKINRGKEGEEREMLFPR